MMPDPAPVTGFAWSEIGKLLHNLWFFFALNVSFATLFLTAHAFIPSLISTGHITQRANLIRFSLYLIAFGLFGLSLTILAFTVDIAQSIEVFYDRYWI